MITIFTSPKPFVGHIAVIQTNAIRSWKQLYPKCEIILLGSEKGTAEVAKSLHLKHIPKVKCNEYGTPFINDLFQQTELISKFNILCYTNCDIIFVEDFLKTVNAVHQQKKEFVLVGQRCDLEIRKNLNFDNPKWPTLLKLKAYKYGTIHPHYGIDYFVFPKGQLPNLPPFLVGRASWDGWLVYHTIACGMSLIDATQSVTAIHQNHDYLHHPLGKSGVYWDGPEALHNLRLAGSDDHLFDIGYAPWVCDQQGLRRKRFFRQMLDQVKIGRDLTKRDIHTWPKSKYGLNFGGWLFKDLFKWTFLSLKYHKKDYLKHYHFVVKTGRNIGAIIENYRRQ